MDQKNKPKNLTKSICFCKYLVMLSVIHEVSTFSVILGLACPPLEGPEPACRFTRRRRAGRDPCLLRFFPFDGLRIRMTKKINYSCTSEVHEQSNAFDKK